MIKGDLIAALDGNFKKEQPTHTVTTYRDEAGKWSVTKAGPKYRNVYAVTEFDAAGEAWLEAHREKEAAKP